MNRFLASTALTAVLFAGAASAQVPLAFDDTSVDYTNSDLDSAWLSLQMIDGVLVLMLDDRPSGASLPAIAFDVPDLGLADFAGNEMGAVIGDVADVELSGNGVAVQGIDVMHEDVTLRETTAAYQNALETQGFTVEATNSDNGNFSTLVASGQGGDLRIVLHRTGGNVTANLSRSSS
jgi:hypothetical protein